MNPATLPEAWAEIERLQAVIAGQGRAYVALAGELVLAAAEMTVRKESERTAWEAFYAAWDVPVDSRS